MVTNQIHKWAHLPAEKLSPTLRALQRGNLILSPEHHDRHHAEPYLSHYCITVGWMNPVLDGLGFFRGLERVLSAVTGAVPREANGEAEEFGVYGEVVVPPEPEKKPATRVVPEA
jgi:ubiquitin-conjugating enzyme E2 variant